jgi:IclR family transcriptional regulator, KDG regulon repressor
MDDLISLQKPKPANLVQAIERASSILDALGQNPQGISVRELSAQVSLPKGTTHRLLSSLAYFGYVRQNARNRNYSLGFKLVELGNRLLNQLDFRAEAKPLLADLAKRIQETVHLVVLDNNEVLYIDKVESNENTSSLRMASRVGSRTPAHSCAVGKVLLAHFSEEALGKFIKNTKLPKMTENTINDPVRLKEHLKLVRSQGYVVDDEENEKGIRCVAAPIRNEVGKVIAATSISGPAVRITRKKIQESLKDEIIETTSKISWKLGFRGEIQ